MRIILNELRKIFSPMMIVLILLSFALCFGIRFYSDIDYYLDGSPDGLYSLNYDYKYLLKLKEICGETLEPDEFESVVLKDYDALIAMADELIAANETFAEYGVHSYQEFDEYCICSDEEYEKMSDEEINLCYERQDDMRNILDSNLDHITKKIDKHEFIIHEYNEYYSPEVSAIAYSTEFDDLFQWVLVFLLICVSITVSPMLVTDNMRNIRPLQYHSSAGRGILIYQLVATIIAACVTTVGFITFLMLTYLSTGLQAFWNSPLKGFYNYARWINFKFDFTLGQFVLFMSALCMLFAIGLSMIIFFLAKISSNYISLILKLIPACIAACIFGYHESYRPFFRNYDPVTYEYLDSYNMSFVWAAAAMLITGAVLAIFVMWREKKREI